MASCGAQYPSRTTKACASWSVSFSSLHTGRHRDNARNDDGWVLYDKNKRERSIDCATINFEVALCKLELTTLGQKDRPMTYRAAKPNATRRTLPRIRNLTRIFFPRPTKPTPCECAALAFNNTINVLRKGGHYCHCAILCFAIPSILPMIKTDWIDKMFSSQSYILFARYGHYRHTASYCRIAAIYLISELGALATDERRAG